MVMQMRRNAGFMFRESGQAMDRLGMSMMGDYSYMEPREYLRPRPLLGADRRRVRPHHSHILAAARGGGGALRRRGGL